MPDWFYRTVARPILFRMPDRYARTLALGMMGTLARLPGGGRVIDFLGHMRPAAGLVIKCGSTTLASPILLSWRVDPERRAGAAFARFGVGAIEVRDGNAPDVIRTRDGLQETAARSVHGAKQTLSIPIFHHSPQTENTEYLISPDGARWPIFPWSEAPRALGTTGVVLQTGHRDTDGCWTVPLRPPEGLLKQVAAWRGALGAGAAIVVSGGVAEPVDAVDLIKAGADLLLIDAGLVHHGPGLVKRCNAALLAARDSVQPAANDPAPTSSEKPSSLRQAWFWAAALGCAMLGGGALALVLAFSRVLLPYDEHFLGLSALELARLNPKLLAFMAHDRATLAGVMLGLGWIYWRLALEGIRRGRHAAWLAVVSSALTGFASFFYFLGFGYFDPLHGFVTAILFQLLLLVMTGGQSPAPRCETLDLKEDCVWRRAQWGQFLLIIHATGLLIAGVIISVIGLTQVFVSEDVAFLCIAPGSVSALGERLTSVVAHDRATLGGMLLASGVVSLLPTLWSFDRGACWLRTALLGLGLPAYVAAIGVHHSVGYTDWHHLLPAWLGAALWALGLGLSWDYLAHPRTGPREHHFDPTMGTANRSVSTS